MKVKNNIYNIEINKIHPHPDNPRKNLGDLEEMTDSIRKNGIMQNLTVMPGHWNNGEWSDEDYTILIGHRRHAAAVNAGVDKLPCRLVEDIEQKEQLGIMLEENMQRHDLTIYEQAQGFQMMLDLGETIETLEEKTGFSKTTIYHRLNIAKLNQKVLKQKEEDESFQLSIKDLCALEKIKSITKRNQILKDARDSKNLLFMADNAAREEQRDNRAKKILKELKDRNLEENKDIRSWDRDWEVIKNFDLDKDEKITLKKTSEKLYYNINYGSLLIAIKAKKETEKKNTISDAEKELRRNRKILTNVQQELFDKIKEFIRQLLLKKYDWIKDESLTEEVWNCLMNFSITVSLRNLKERMYTLWWDDHKNFYNMTDEDKQLVADKMKEYPVEYQMLSFFVDLGFNKTEYPAVMSYYNEYRLDSAETVKRLICVIERFGFSITEDEQKFLDGTHDSFKKA